MWGTFTPTSGGGRASNAGCYDDGICSGTVTACDTHLDSTSCNAQSNCYWSSTSGSCATAVFTTCATWTIESYCLDHPGCTFTPTCSGTAYSCALSTDEISCGDQPGCVWE